MRFKRDRRGRWLDVEAPGAEELPFLGAAYLLTDRACVVVRRAGVSFLARLEPARAGGLAALQREFASAYANQRLRWALAARPAADEPDGGASSSQQRPSARLSAERRREIAAALAGADAEPAARDPLGVRRPWEDLRR